MKINNILLPILAILLTSCEEVIDLELNDTEPKLVIEATVSVIDDETTSAFVKLSTTFPYFETQQLYVEDAQVQIVSENQESFIFNHIENGRYETQFTPELFTNYTLEVIYKGEVYTGTTQLVTTPQYNGLVDQNILNNFGETSIELKAYFNDPEDETNFYFYIGKSVYGTLYDTFNDAFFSGNQMFTSYTSTDLKPGDIVNFKLYGITQENYNYFFTLLQQTDNTAFGPFTTQPATVRGNIVNQTNPENFPLGYFRISEVASFTYTVQ